MPTDWRTLARIFEADGFTRERTTGTHVGLSKPGALRPVIVPKYAEVGLDIIRSTCVPPGCLGAGTSVCSRKSEPSPHLTVPPSPVGAAVRNHPSRGRSAPGAFRRRHGQAISVPATTAAGRASSITGTSSATPARTMRSHAGNGIVSSPVSALDRLQVLTWWNRPSALKSRRSR